MSAYISKIDVAALLGIDLSAVDELCARAELPPPVIEGDSPKWDRRAIIMRSVRRAVRAHRKLS